MQIRNITTQPKNNYDYRLTNKNRPVPKPRIDFSQVDTLNLAFSHIGTGPITDRKKRKSHNVPVARPLFKYEQHINKEIETLLIQLQHKWVFRDLIKVLEITEENIEDLKTLLRTKRPSYLLDTPVEEQEKKSVPIIDSPDDAVTLITAISINRELTYSLIDEKIIRNIGGKNYIRSKYNPTDILRIVELDSKFQEIKIKNPELAEALEACGESSELNKIDISEIEKLCNHRKELALTFIRKYGTARLKDFISIGANFRNYALSLIKSELPVDELLSNLENTNNDYLAERTKLKEKYKTLYNEELKNLKEAVANKHLEEDTMKAGKQNANN